MTRTQEKDNDMFNDLQLLLGKIKALAHGAWASAEFFSDESAEIALMALAKELTAEAEDLVSQLHKSALKALPGTTEDKGDIKILPPRICSNN